MPDRRLKIAMLVNEFPVLSETFVGTQMRALERLGHEVIPIAFKRGIGPAQPRDARLAERTIALSSLPQIPDPRYLPTSLPGLLRAITFIRAQKGLPGRSLAYHGLRLATLLKQTGACHIQAQFAWAAASHAIIAARLAGIGVSFVSHGADVYGGAVDLPAKLAHADIAFATCDAMAEHLHALAPAARVERISMGVDLSSMPPAMPAARPAEGFLFVGRLVEKKGIAILLDAMARIPAAARPRLDIVGAGPLEETIRARIGSEGLSDRVALLGARSSEWVLAHARDYRAVVVPCVPASDGDRDTGPLIAKEAMALGVPVIASDFMGLAEIVDGHCGISVPHGSAEALSQALGRAMAWTSAERHKLGAAGRARIEALFSDTIAARRVAELTAGL
jgi:glycosyltransferase involved in cell wall biosynthesis